MPFKRSKSNLSIRKQTRKSNGEECKLTIEQEQLIKIATRLFKNRKINLNMLKNRLTEYQIGTVITQILNPEKELIFGFEHKKQYFNTSEVKQKQLSELIVALDLQYLRTHEDLIIFLKNKFKIHENKKYSNGSNAVELNNDQSNLNEFLRAIKPQFKKEIYNFIETEFKDTQDQEIIEFLKIPEEQLKLADLDNMYKYLEDNSENTLEYNNSSRRSSGY